MVRIGGRSKKKKKLLNVHFGRIYFLIVFFLLCGAVILGQLFRLQVWQHRIWRELAAKQYNIYRPIQAKRGEFFWQDLSNAQVLSLVINRPVYNFFIVPRDILDVESAVPVLNELLTEVSASDSNKSRVIKAEDLLLKLQNREDPYERLITGLAEEEKDFIIKFLSSKDLPSEAYGFDENYERYYVESTAAHLTGFLGFAPDGYTRVGQYGLEEYFDAILRGQEGLILTDKDARGRPIGVGRRIVEKASDGYDIILTIDRNIQYKACSSLQSYIEKYGAEGGTIIIMDPRSGRLYALCGYPDFDPNNYAQGIVAHFINPTVSQEYEPGSIFKPITMAAALDTNAVTPWTTYLDTGQVVIDKYIIKNADGQAHGVNTMIDVLDKSLNTGAIFTMRSVGMETFTKYVHKFGFGKLTGIELAGEVDGDVKPLEKGSEIYAATASFGQGITVTPLQLVVAYSAIARGGTLIKPTLIEKIKGGGEEKEFIPQEASRVISKQTADTLSMMLVSSVRKGYAKKAAVAGYKIAGKTGTAQVSKPEGGGYGDWTIHSFIGFGPVGEREPIFVMLVKLDKPVGVRFASDSIAPLFGEVAKFVLDYLAIPPDE